MTFPETVAAMVPHLPIDAVITDVGSVKEWVVRRRSEPLLGPGMTLVECPSGGRQGDRRRGRRGGGAVRQPARDRDAVGAQRRGRGREVIALSGVATAAPAVEELTPASHDRDCSRARAICRNWSRARSRRRSKVNRSTGKRATEYGAGGLADDTARIAASSAEMWRDICVTNRGAILAALETVRADRSINSLTPWSTATPDEN